MRIDTIQPAIGSNTPAKRLGRVINIILEVSDPAWARRAARDIKVSGRVRAAA